MSLQSVIAEQLKASFLKKRHEEKSLWQGVCAIDATSNGGPFSFDVLTATLAGEIVEAIKPHGVDFSPTAPMEVPLEQGALPVEPPEPEPFEKVCKGKTFTGKPCRSRALPGSSYCKRHE